MELTEYKLAFIETNRLGSMKDAAAVKFRDTVKNCVYTTRVSMQSSLDNVSVAAFISTCSAFRARQQA